MVQSSLRSALSRSATESLLDSPFGLVVEWGAVPAVAGSQTHQTVRLRVVVPIGVVGVGRLRGGSGLRVSLRRDVTAKDGRTIAKSVSTRSW